MTIEHKLPFQQLNQFVGALHLTFIMNHCFAILRYLMSKMCYYFLCCVTQIVGSNKNPIIRNLNLKLYCAYFQIFAIIREHLHLSITQLVIFQNKAKKKVYKNGIYSFKCLLQVPNYFVTFFKILCVSYVVGFHYLQQ